MKEEASISGALPKENITLRNKTLLCLIVLLLTFGPHTTYGEDNSSLNQETINRLRETYNLEAPGPPSMLSGWSEGDWGISLDPSSLPDLIHITLHPVWFFTRQLVRILSS